MLFRTKKNILKSYTNNKYKLEISDNFVHKKAIWQKGYDKLARFPTLYESLACI